MNDLTILEEEEEARNLERIPMQNGYTVQQLCAATGMADNTLRKWLERLGVKDKGVKHANYDENGHPHGYVVLYPVTPEQVSSFQQQQQQREKLEKAVKKDANSLVQAGEDLVRHSNGNVDATDIVMSKLTEQLRDPDGLEGYFAAQRKADDLIAQVFKMKEEAHAYQINTVLEALKKKELEVQKAQQSSEFWKEETVALIPLEVSKEGFKGASARRECRESLEYRKQMLKERVQ